MHFFHHGIGVDGRMFILMTMMAAMLFVVWLAAMILRGIWLAISRCLGFLTGQPRREAVEAAVRCAALRCGAYSPAGANYCRRCGAPMNRAASGARRMAG
jgi:ribosomal protein L40E